MRVLSHEKGHLYLRPMPLWLDPLEKGPGHHQTGGPGTGPMQVRRNGRILNDGGSLQADMETEGVARRRTVQVMPRAGP